MDGDQRHNGQCPPCMSAVEEDGGELAIPQLYITYDTYEMTHMISLRSLELFALPACANFTSAPPI